MAVKAYYQYDPSQPAAIAVCALFSVNFLISSYVTFRKRAWIWLVMLVGTLLEVIGYGARIKSVTEITEKSLYIAQFIPVVLAPVLMTGGIYVVFGRIVFHVVPPRDRTTKLLWVPSRWITPIFVTFDVVCLILQLVGAVIVSGTDLSAENAQDRLDKGRSIALGGLGLQIAAFGLFSVVAIRFHFTSRRFIQGLLARLGKADGEKRVFVKGSKQWINPHWRRLLYTVNAACLLILVRSIYRVVEFEEGPMGEVKSVEWYVYVFDALPMFIVVCAFNLFPPSSYLPFMGFRVPEQHDNAPSEITEESSIVLREQV